MSAAIYPMIKGIHMLTAALSISGFIVRAYFALYKPGLLEKRWLKIAPHVNDSILLGCAIYLAVMLQQSPGRDDWLTAKLIALVVYILLGMVTLKWANTPVQRKLALTAALLTYAYIAVVAVSKSPWPIL